MYHKERVREGRRGLSKVCSQRLEGVALALSSVWI